MYNMKKEEIAEKRHGIGSRGQGMSITAIMLTLLGVAVVVLLIIGVMNGFDFITDLWERAPTFEVIVQSCSTFGENKLIGDYCKAFKDAKLPSGQKSFLNCQFDDIEALNSETRLSDSVCGKESDNAKKFCEDKRAEVTRQGRTFDASNVRVNGRFCDEWGVVNLKSCVDGLSGLKLDASKGCNVIEAGKRTFVLPKGEYLDQEDGKVCCVYSRCSELKGIYISSTESCPQETIPEENDYFERWETGDQTKKCCVPKPA